MRNVRALFRLRKVFWIFAARKPAACAMNEARAKRGGVLAESNENTKLGRLFFDLFRQLKHYMRKNFEDQGITMPQGMVVGTLIRNGEMKTTELGSRLNMTNSTISGILDRLEKQGVVERRRSKEDRRIVYVKVTPNFGEMHKEMLKKIEKSFQELLDTATPEELAKITEGFDTLKKILTNYNEATKYLSPR